MKCSFHARVMGGLGLLACVIAAPAGASTLVVAGDEWVLAYEAYQQHGASTQALVADIAGQFGGSKYLLLTGNPYISGGQIADLTTQLGGLGKTVSTSNAAFTLALAQGYDAVFHFGQIIDQTALTTYVNGGGNAYVSLGAGYYGTAQGEADAWNGTLSQFGLVAGNSWFPGGGYSNVSVTAGPANVNDLIWGYGQSIEAVGGGLGQSYVRGSLVGGPSNVGLLGISSTAPEPAGWALMISGFAGAGVMLRRRRAAVA